jgi:hypothetical protein
VVATKHMLMFLDIYGLRIGLLSGSLACDSRPLTNLKGKVLDGIEMSAKANVTYFRPIAHSSIALCLLIVR